MMEHRHSSSLLIAGVTRRVYTGNTDKTVPDCCCDLLVITRPEGVEVVLTGAITQPIPLEFSQGTQVMNITFKPNTFFPEFPGISILNKGVNLRSAGKNKVWLGSEVVEIPTFNNAEEFIEKLRRIGSIKTDALVSGVLTGKPLAASERSVQRHFLQTTGMTMKFMQQVQRAQVAAEMVKSGQRIADVAHSLGFTDQAHMTRSLKGILGVTPAAIKQEAVAAPVDGRQWFQELDTPLYHYGL